MPDNPGAALQRQVKATTEAAQKVTDAARQAAANVPAPAPMPAPAVPPSAEQEDTAASTEAPGTKAG